jgi:ferredoxin
MKLLFVYFSGTGNTDYVARYLARKLAHLPIEIELCSMEWQPAEAIANFELLAVGFPVYAADAPIFFQDYLRRLSPGQGRGVFVFCTKGAFAGSAVRLTCERLAVQGYVPLAGGAIGMPGSDGLAMISKDSWMARKALGKDYDHLQDADRLSEEMVSILSKVVDGHPPEVLSQMSVSRSGATMSDRVWSSLYRATENWCRTRLHADERCEGCGLCVQLCPVDNVELQDGRACFGDQCVLCIRCLHACSQEAIQIGRVTVGKFRWKGPKGDFQPIRLRPRDAKGPDL